jgi:LysR family hydrogen peroxide-inducible transcriptional activator
MNLQQLEYILALDKFKSFSKAAESCYITQATLSTMVKKLEEELDVIIFDRKTNPIITTECGKEILAEAQIIVNHTKTLKFLASEVKGTIKGEMNIGIIPTISSSLLHRILPTILKKFPELKLNIQEITTNNIIIKLKTGELDFGIVSTPLNILEIEEEILYYEKLVVYGCRDNENTKFINATDISNEKVWLMEKGNCLTEQIMNVCSLNTKNLFTNLNFYPSTLETLINLVDNLEGLTLIPELYFLDLPNEKKKHVCDFTPPFPVREVGIIYHRPYAKLRLMEALSKEIKDAIKPFLQTTKLKNSDMIIAKI